MSRRPVPDHTGADPLDNWPARLAEIAEAARMRQADRRAVRAELAAARTAGLRARHTAKLARSANPQDVPTGRPEAVSGGPSLGHLPNAQGADAPERQA